MYVLSPGTTLSLHQIQPFLLGVDGSREVLDHADTAEAEALCLGVDTLGPLGQALLEKGLVSRADGLIDEVLLAALQRLDRMYAWWQGQLDPEALRAFELTQQAHAHRKRFLWTFGQCPTLPETSLRRALLAPRGESLEILCIGDDDLVCVALAALGHRVTVFDLDPYLLTLIDRFAATHGLSIETAAVDLCAPVDARYASTFDICFTDPCSNESCLSLFLSRGICCLKLGGTAHVAVMHPAETMYRELTAGMQFPIVGFQHDFNHYYWASMKLAYYISDAYSHRRTAETTPRLALDEPFPATDELFDDFETPDCHPYAVDFYEIDTASATPERLSQLFAECVPLAGETILDLGSQLTYSANRARGGFVNLLVDRDKHYMKFTMMPLNLQEERLVRQALMAAFGGKALTNRTSSGPDIELF